MSTESPYDLDAITARVREQLGQEFDEEAAGRPLFDDSDRFIMDTEGFFAGQGEGSPAAPPTASDSPDSDPEGQGSEEEGETAPTAPSSSDDPSTDPAADDLPPVEPGEVIPVTRPDTEPEVAIVIPGLTDDEPIATTDESLAGQGQGGDASIGAPDASPPTTPDRFDYSTYFEHVYGEVPPVEQVEGIFSFVEKVNRTPPEYQNLIAQIVDGTFDPVAFARAVLPQSSDGDDDGDRFLDPSARQPVQPQQPIVDPRVEAEIQRLRSLEQQVIVQGVDQAMTEFRQAHPHLSREAFAALAKQVNASRGWETEVARGVSPKDAYLRHLNATALADPRYAPAVRPVTPAASTPATPPPDPTPRQAANAAIAGTSSPTSPSPRRRRSPLGGGDGAAPQWEKAESPADAEAKLRERLKSGVAEILGGTG